MNPKPILIVVPERVLVNEKMQKEVHFVDVWMILGFGPWEGRAFITLKTDRVVWILVIPDFIENSVQ